MSLLSLLHQLNGVDAQGKIFCDAHSKETKVRNPLHTFPYFNVYGPSFIVFFVRFFLHLKKLKNKIK